MKLLTTIPSLRAPWGETFYQVQVYLAEYVVYRSEYADGIPALVLYTDWGEPLSTVTINLAQYGIVPAEGMVLLRATEEGEGWPDLLASAGVVRLTGRKFQFGRFGSYALEAKLLVQKEN